MNQCIGTKYDIDYMSKCLVERWESFKWRDFFSNKTVLAVGVDDNVWKSTFFFKNSSRQSAVAFLFTDACVTGWLGQVLSCVCACRTSSASHCRGVTLPWVMRTPPSKPPDQRPSTWPWRWLGSCCPVPQWWRVCCYRRRWRSSPSPPGVWSVTRSPTVGSNGTLRAWRHLEAETQDRVEVDKCRIHPYSISSHNEPQMYTNTTTKM